MLGLARRIIVIFYFLLVSIACLILAALRPFDLINSYRFLTWLSPVSLKILGLKFEIEGKVPEQRPLVVIGNHQHTFDVFIYGSVLPPKTVAIGKKSIVFIPLFGQLFWLTGQFLLDRKNTSKAYGTLGAVKERAVKEKINVLIFPEGTRSKGKGLLPFKKGAFHLAIEMGAPLVAVVTNSYLKDFDYNRWVSGTIKVKILPPISTAGMNLEQVDALMASTRELIINTQKELDRA